MQIIPAIDIIEGKCVRLTEGDYSQKKIYNEHPLEVAKEFEGAGLQRLHLVDLDGAKAGAVKNWKVLETITSKTSLIIDFGGGIKKVEDVSIVFNSGAALATVGSIAVKDLPCDGSKYQAKTLTSTSSSSLQFTSQSDGSIWLFTGTESGFEGKTTLYYQKVELELTPL